MDNQQRQQNLNYLKEALPHLTQSIIEPVLNSMKGDVDKTLDELLNLNIGNEEQPQPQQQQPNPNESIVDYQKAFEEEKQYFEQLELVKQKKAEELLRLQLLEREEQERAKLLQQREQELLRLKQLQQQQFLQQQQQQQLQQEQLRQQEQELERKQQEERRRIEAEEKARADREQLLQYKEMLRIEEEKKRQTQQNEAEKARQLRELEEQRLKLEEERRLFAEEKQKAEELKKLLEEKVLEQQRIEKLELERKVKEEQERKIVEEQRKREEEERLLAEEERKLAEEERKRKEEELKQKDDSLLSPKEIFLKSTLIAPVVFIYFRQAQQNIVNSDEQASHLRQIFISLGVNSYAIRVSDISSDYELASFLKSCYRDENIVYPFVSIHGKPVGNYAKILELNNNGTLRQYIDQPDTIVDLTRDGASYVGQNVFDHCLDAAEYVISGVSTILWLPITILTWPFSGGKSELSKQPMDVDFPVVHTNWYWRGLKRIFRFGSDRIIRIHPSHNDVRASHLYSSILAIHVLDENNLKIQYDSQDTDFLTADPKDIQLMKEIITRKNPQVYVFVQNDNNSNN